MMSLRPNAQPLRSLIQLEYVIAFRSLGRTRVEAQNVGVNTPSTAPKIANNVAMMVVNKMQQSGISVKRIFVITD